jgi:hypothetical protein
MRPINRLTLGIALGIIAVMPASASDTLAPTGTLRAVYLATNPAQANRQRLTTLLAEMPGYRLLPDNLFGVTQTVAIPKGKPEALAALNRFIDEVRASGFLQDAITRSGSIGVEVAPAGSDRR